MSSEIARRSVSPAKLVDMWNRRFPVGTPVMYTLSGKIPRKGVTASRATVLPNFPEKVVVQLVGHMGVFDISTLEPLEPEERDGLPRPACLKCGSDRIKLWKTNDESYYVGCFVCNERYPIFPWAEGLRDFGKFFSCPSRTQFDAETQGNSEESAFRKAMESPAEQAGKAGE